MSFAAAVVLVGLAGFISLSYEIVWYRAIAFASGGSPAAFGLLLGYYLVGLAMGAYLTGRYCAGRGAAGRPVIRALALFILGANLAGFAVLPLLAWFAVHAVHAVWAPALGAVAVAAAALGAILPLVSHLAIPPDDLAGARLSYLYLANILCAAAGSLVTGFVLMDVLPLRAIALLLLLLGVLLAVALAIAAADGPRDVAVAGVAGAALAAAAVGVTPGVFDGFYERLLYKHDFPAEPRFAHVVENRSGVITVTPDGVTYGGGAYDGKIATDPFDDRNGIVRAYAAAALHPRPARVLMIGLSTGAWAQVLTQLPGVEDITIVEINPGYLDLIRRYPAVAGVLRDPRVHIVIDDGRRWLSRHRDRRFDLIVSNVTFHWRAHTTNLLSREYLELIRIHLRTGGVYYYNTTGSEDVLKTALATYPYGLRFLNFVALSEAPLAFDRDRFAAALATYRGGDAGPAGAIDAARTDRVLAYGDSTGPHSERRALETRTEALARLDAARIVTDDNMVPEWRQLVLSP
jgi:spermidine synthase